MDGMKPFDNIDKIELPLKTIDTARILLRYSFVDIDFKYESLTRTEQKLVTKKEFERLVKQFKLT